MYHNVKEEVFDGILKAALYEYIYDLDKSLPSDEEIAQMYPISRKEARKYKRIAKVNKYRAPLTVVYLRRAAAAVLVAVSLSFGLLATSAKVRAAIVDTVVEWYDKYIKIDFGNASDADTDENGMDAIVASVHDITSDRQALIKLVSLCNSLELSTIHLMDVVEDFLAS